MSEKPDSKIRALVENQDTSNPEAPGTGEIVPVEIDFDTMLTEQLRRADSGDPDAVRSLLEQAADWLCLGEIPDDRLRDWLDAYLNQPLPRTAKHRAYLPGLPVAQCEFDRTQQRLWLAEYLTDRISAMPNRTGRPSKIMDHFELALAVQFKREANLTEQAAIDQVHESTSANRESIQRHYDQYRQAAKTWVSVHGCRLPNRSALPSDNQDSNAIE